jgi:hypothetical protein
MNRASGLTFPREPLQIYQPVFCLFLFEYYSKGTKHGCSSLCLASGLRKWQRFL